MSFTKTSVHLNSVHGFSMYRNWPVRQWLCIPVYLYYLHSFINEDHIEWHIRVSHPEERWLESVKQEKHASCFRHCASIHKTGFHFFGCICNFNIDCFNVFFRFLIDKRQFTFLDESWFFFGARVVSEVFIISSPFIFITKGVFIEVCV